MLNLSHNICLFMTTCIGYNGTFPFEKPGDPYEDHNYMGMRIVCTAMGAALVPLRFVFVVEEHFLMLAHKFYRCLNFYVFDLLLWLIVI